MMTHDDHTATFAALVDTLLPGDRDFPTASSVDAQALVMARLGAADTARIAALLASRGGAFAGMSAAERVTVVRWLERAHPALFGDLLTITYLSYYQRPAVAAAIRAQGVPYNDTPQPRGYELPAFDPTRDAPRHDRGHYVPTAAVTRIALPAGLGTDGGSGR